MSRVAEVRVFRTTDGRLVGESDLDAAYLVAGVGGVVPDEYDDQPLPGEVVEADGEKPKARRAAKAEAAVEPKATDNAEAADA